jgi:hypothetical protein
MTMGVDPDVEELDEAPFELLQAASTRARQPSNVPASQRSFTAAILR